MNAQVEALKQQAIEILLTERNEIDTQLDQLGHNKTAPLLKKRGRPKQLSTVVHSDTTQSGEPFPL